MGKIKNALVLFVRALVILPMTAGGLSRSSKETLYHNGSISMIVLFLFLLGFLFVFIQTPEIEQDSQTLQNISLTILSVTVIMGTIVCAAIGEMTRRYGMNYLAKPKSHCHSKKLNLLFLWLFGITSILYCISKLALQVECDDYGTDFIYYLTVSVFVIVEMLFISVYITFRFKRILMVNYAMLLLVAANLSVWFNTFVREHSHHVPQVNITVDPMHMSEEPCHVNSSISKMIKSTRHIAIPVFLEYSLHSLSIIFELFYPHFIKQDNDTLTNVDEKMEIEESKCLLNVEIVTSRKESTMKKDQYIKTSRSNISNLHVYITVGLSFLIVAGLFCMFVILETGIRNNKICNVLFWYSTGLKLLMIVALFVGFFCAGKYLNPNEGHTERAVNEWIYILSSFGMLTGHIYETVTGQFVGQAYGRGIFVSYILSIPQDYLQTVFLLHTRRCVKRNTHVRHIPLECLCLFLMTSNFGLWVINTFFVSHIFDLQELKKHILGQSLSTFFERFCIPMIIYYRFASSFAFHDLFQKFAKTI